MPQAISFDLAGRFPIVQVSSAWLVAGLHLQILLHLGIVLKQDSNLGQMLLDHGTINLFELTRQYFGDPNIPNTIPT